MNAKQPKDLDELLVTGGVEAIRNLRSVPVDDESDPGIAEEFALTDVGNGKRFVRDHGRIVRYCPPKRKWLVWSGTRWVWDETGRVVELAKATVRTIYDEATACDDLEKRKALSKHAIASERAPRIAAMLEMAQSEAGIPVLPGELDADPWLLNCDNGTIELRTGNLVRHDPNDLLTKITPAEYLPPEGGEAPESALSR